jgi:hypothetical protein
MPKNKDKSQDRPAAAQKKPAAPQNRGPRAKSAEKEARLAEALRANLRRRKASGAGGAADKKDE